MWTGQCWGCGGPGVKEELNFDCSEYQYYFTYDEEQGRSDEEEERSSILKQEFCCETCLLGSIRQLAKTTYEMRRYSEQYHKGYSTLWYLLKEDCSFGAASRRAKAQILR
jgi:hypothetical protein